MVNEKRQGMNDAHDDNRFEILKNALDTVHSCRIISANILELSPLDKKRVVDMTKNVLVSDLIQYLIKNNYLEIKEEQIENGLKLECQLVILNKEKLKNDTNKT